MSSCWQVSFDITLVTVEEVVTADFPNDLDANFDPIIKIINIRFCKIYQFIFDHG